MSFSVVQQGYGVSWGLGGLEGFWLRIEALSM